ncbi:MAG: ATP-grasp domain-containing protein, partial [Methanomicrobiales archaeon]|nr:ATP-grasp domain-containing protein [Methanomicrobiales archaeon]
RTRTDPMNIAYVVARMAAFHNIPVIDDPASIRICSDKVNMYSHLIRHNIAIPRTVFITKKDLTPDCASRLFSTLGTPLILKEPSTSFSCRVEKVADPETFYQVARRFNRLSDWIVVQQYVESTYDWRVGVLGGKLLYVCKYTIPPETFKIQASVNGHIVYCGVESVPEGSVPPGVISLGLEAARAIGNGLYGVDIKNSNGDACVIEVNDNPSIESGEDDCYPRCFAQIVGHLLPA